MTSLRRKNDPRPKMSATNLSFYKYITEDSSKETNCKVPTSYVKKYQEKYGKELSKVVRLKLPCGAEWEVEVTGHNGHFWFEKGWENFSKFYCLQAHDLLAFHYEGNFQFKVHIYGKSKTEIEYPIKSINMLVNGVNDHSPPVTPPVPQKTEEATTSGGKNDHSAEKHEGGKSSTTQRSEKPTTEVPMRMQALATGGEATALQSAKEFESRNPSCFLVIMRSTYIKVSMLWLSTRASTNLLTCIGKHSGNVSLRVLEKSTSGPWTVEMKYDAERAAFRLQGGWKKFVQANNLNAGDVCAFMLVDKDELLFDVNIFRRTEVATSSPGIYENDVDGKDEHGHHDANDDYAANGNRQCSFRNVIQKSSISHCLWLCSSFPQKYLSTRPSYAELHVPGGTTTWRVGLKYEDGRKRAKFQSGWTKFVRANNLKIGDERVFVLTDELIFSFEVVMVAAKSILPPDMDDANDNNKDDEDTANKDGDDDYDDDEEDDDALDISDDDYSDNKGDDYDDDNDHSDEADEYSLAQHLHKRKRSSSSTKSSIKDASALTSTGHYIKRRPGVQRGTHPLRAMKNDTAPQIAKSFKYGKPHFVVPMTARNVQRSLLKLPSAFVKKHFDEIRPSHVSLWGSNDIYWPVELHFSKGANFLKGGWIEFVRRHNLKQGDACGFELTEKTKFLFDVHIFRAT